MTAVRSTVTLIALVVAAGCASVADDPPPKPVSCTGHDEDGDGVADDCDNCPNVANPGQSGGAIGDACAAPVAFIASAPSRALFDPFRTLDAKWNSLGTGSEAFAPGSDSDSIVGGNSTTSACATPAGGGGTVCRLPFVASTLGLGAAPVVATAVLSVGEDNTGSTGLLARVSGPDGAKSALLCALSLENLFAIARLPDSGCSGAECQPITFSAGTGAALLPIPTDIPHGIGTHIGLRVSVTTTRADGQGDIECRIFDPKRPETLHSTDPKYALRITPSATRWRPSGEIGFYAQRARASLHSIDILRGP